MVLLALILTLIAGLVAMFNLAVVFAAFRGRNRVPRRGYSLVHLASAACGGAGCLLGHSTLGWWPLLPAACDPGTWTMAIASLLLLRKAWRSRSASSDRRP